jgi:NADPH:quinone reductase-like Zn-dependent oxidoreductase
MMRPRTAEEKAAIADDLYRKVWPILSAGRCWPVIDKVFPLVNASDAHRRMEAGEHIGKIVLKVAD